MDQIARNLEILAYRTALRQLIEQARELCESVTNLVDEIGANDYIVDSCLKSTRFAIHSANDVLGS